MNEAHPNSRLVRKFSVDKALAANRHGWEVRERIPHDYGYSLVYVDCYQTRDRAIEEVEKMGTLLPEGWTG